MAYTRVNWQDLPSTSTPRNATNLNKMDEAIKTNDDKLLGNTAMGNIQTTGAIMRGTLNLKEGDLILSTPNASSDDSRDIVFNYGNGNEKARIWVENDISITHRANFRSYNPSGTQLENSLLALVNDVKITKISTSVTVPANSIAKYDLANITVPTGYKMVGVLPYVNGFGDQWLVSISYYSGKIVAMIQSKYNGSLTSTIECFAIFLKQDYYDRVLTT